MKIGTIGSDNLLRADAPPARDPVFRLRVLERREQRQFQRRSFTMLAGALVIILVSTFGVSIGGGALRNDGRAGRRRRPCQRLPRLSRPPAADSQAL